jgi:dephospho-CoA kinase
MSHSFPLVIGLTGGIGSGKTTVSDLFAAKGVEVVDADLISRALVARGQPLLQQLVAILGPHILLPNGELDRPGLRQRLFSNESTRLQVEALLHPAIRAAIVERLQQSRAAWVLLVAPLLLESKAYGFVDRVLVVDLPEQLQP